MLVKAALFLTVGAVAALDRRARTLALIVAALLGLSLAGLPLTGGALAKLALKDLFGDGAPGLASQLSAAATTALMLLFVCGSRGRPQAERAGRRPGACGPGRRWRSPHCSSPGSCSPLVASAAEAFEPAKLGDAVWPMPVGAALAGALWAVGNRLPRIPAGDIVVAEEAAFRASLRLGAAFERADRGLREWPAAGLALLMVALALVAAGYASR